MSDCIVWVDVETSGLYPENDHILEIGTIVSDMQGKSRGDHYAALFDVRGLNSVISSVSPLVRDMHEESGLWSDLWTETTKSAAQVDAEISAWLDDVCAEFPGKRYFGGNSIVLDRGFVRANLPTFDKKLSYRSVDVTSISMMLQANFGVGGFDKMNKHRALSDAMESMEEYRHHLSILKSKTLLRGSYYYE